MDLGVTNEVAPSDITAECESCHQTFLVKYWDEELDWYIELNLSNHCRDCRPAEGSISATQTAHSAKSG